MSTNDWLAQLKEGDTVIVVDGNGRRSVSAVSRFTPKAFAVALSPLRLFNRRTGRERGGETWDSWAIEEATPEDVAAVRDERRFLVLRKRLADVRWSSLPLSVLEQVNAVLEAHAQSKEGE